MRDWRGAPLFCYCIRPFFLGAAIWAALAMGLWIAMLAGLAHIPSHMDATTWHAHEFLFGYLGAVIAGFMLTAVPNWSGHLPVVGRGLMALFALWVLGRGAMATSAFWPVWLAVTLDLAFVGVLALCILREIIAGPGWRNAEMLALLAVFGLSNALFHLDVIAGNSAVHGIGLRLGVGTVVMMIGVVGGRIVPSFTRNWLAKARLDARPVAPMQRFDKAVLVLSGVALLLWLTGPDAPLSGVALLAMGALHLGRMARWQGHRTGAEPLVWVLHAGYSCVPLGALIVGWSILAPEQIARAAALHMWMAGAFGVMTLAVMTRSVLAHIGRVTHAGPGTAAIYGCVILSVAVRLLAGIWPQGADLAHAVSGALWIAGFAGFALLYGPGMIRVRP